MIPRKLVRIGGKLRIAEMRVRDMFCSEGTKFSDAEERVFAREELVYNVTEDILVLLEDLHVSKKELARRLGKSRSYVTQILSGARNMTLGSLSDICFALGVKPKVVLPVFSESEADLFRKMIEKEWVDEKSNAGLDDVILKSTNVVDRREKAKWVTDKVA